MEERFFYHSFPRRRRSTEEEIDKGCRVLTAIRDFGLLLTPQLIEWEQPSASGAPPRVFPVFQKRVCFTELSPAELPQHADRFGHFALEFEIDTVRRLGAVPVLYVPQPTKTARDGSAVGTALLAIAMDSQAVINRMALLNSTVNGPVPVPDHFGFDVGFARTPDGRGTFTLSRDETKVILSAIGHAVTPWNDLNVGTLALMNFFHPTDNDRGDLALEYYREREWRIAAAFRINEPDGTSIEVLHTPTAEERARFLEIDSEFFSRKITTDSGEVSTLDAALVLPGLRTTRILEMVRRVLVPKEAVGRATEILATLDTRPPVVCIDELTPESSRGLVAWLRRLLTSRG